MRKSPVLLALATCIGLLACQKKEEAPPAVEASAPPPVPAEMGAPSAMEDRGGDRMAKMKAMGGRNDVPVAPPQGQFVRSADLQFRCRSVSEATSAIERIVAQNGGFIGLNDLRSTLREQNPERLGTDSVVEISSVEIVNTMELRVPNERLDSVLASIAPLIVFLDHRTIRAQDVSQELRRADREHRRMDRAARRLEAMSQQNPGRIRDLEQVDEQALEREERAENSAAQADALLAQVQLSTIQLAIYQHDETRLDTLKRPLHEIWVEPVWRRFARAFSEGWEGILDVALWFASHWITVLVLALVAVFLRRRMSSKKS